MAQFNYMNEINNLLSMDGELTRGPIPRWQRKLDLSTSVNNSSINTSKPKLSVSYNHTGAAATSISNKTPNKKTSMESKKTPSGKSPGILIKQIQNIARIRYNIFLSVY